MDNIQEQKSGLMYLCGHPGTGKTSSLNLILSQLRKHADKRVIGDFHVLLYNAMTFFDVKVFSKTVLQSLQEKFTDKKDVTKSDYSDLDQQEIA